MKQLKLRVSKKHFQAILKGEQKVEERFIYPENEHRYITLTENPDDTITINPIHYDEIRFVQGRTPDAPVIVVKVTGSQFVVLTDENGEDLTYEEDGETYVVCQVWYNLGEVVSKENVAE